MTVDLVTLIEHRQTRRDFSRAIPDSALGEFLWLTCRNRNSRPSPYGFSQESRAHPSAGAVHPIHVVVGREVGTWLRYDPSEHAFVGLPGLGENLSATRATASRLLELQRGVLLGLVAEPGKTAAKYESVESLVWRDAGVVLGYMSLVAEALQLPFCPLGISGDPHLADIHGAEAGLYGVGLAVLGG